MIGNEEKHLHGNYRQGKNLNIILLSGGSGQRLWLLSNGIRSKQFLKIFRREDGTRESMVQRMYRMVTEADADATITIATSGDQAAFINEQLGDKVGISIEPCRRDTFPAIVLAAAYLHDELGIDADEAAVVCPVDPYAGEDYFRMLRKLSGMAESGRSNLVLMGIEAAYPSVKYGYIIPETPEEISSVKAFKEKPDEKAAAELISQGALWNSGVFAFKIKYVLDMAEELLGSPFYGVLRDNYGTLPKISFDYAVAEKEKSIKVARFSGEWKDLGTWDTLTRVMGDAVAGNAVAADCENTHVINELEIPLVVLGVRDLAVVATPDGILVSDKLASTHLKEYVKERSPMAGE